MKTKKISTTTAIIAILMLAVLSACGEAETTNAPTKEVQKTPETTPTQPVSPPVTTPTPPPQPPKTVEAVKTVTPPPVVTPPSKATVQIEGFRFLPAELTVPKGTTITWTNQDDAPHTVESSDGTLRSDELSKGQSYTKQLNTPGTYAYICGIHPSMKGTIIVTA